MTNGFSGFPQEGIDFMRGLARNNRREWFQPRKAIFDEKVKGPMRDLVAAVNAGLARFAPEYITEPDNAIFRIYRDTRFSKDKKPYKEHIAATFRRGAGCAQADGGYYFAVSHKEVAIGGGIYQPEPASLLAIRGHIAEKHEELRKILADRTLRRLLGELHGEQLSRVPKGFSSEDPAADLLRYKQFTFYIELPPDIATKPGLDKEIVKRYEAMLPFLKFLTAPLLRARPKMDVRDLV